MCFKEEFCHSLLNHTNRLSYDYQSVLSCQHYEKQRMTYRIDPHIRTCPYMRKMGSFPAFQKSNFVRI